MKIKIKRKNKRGAKPSAGAASSGGGRRTRDVRRVIRPATIPYTFWKQWSKARQRGENDLLYDMTHDEGPLRAQFEDREAFIEHARLHPLPSGPGWHLQKIKLDEQDAFLLSTRGVDDPGIRTADIELMHLQRSREGWRLYDARTLRKRKERGNTLEVAFDDFEIPSAEHALKQRLADGWERPDLADHPPEEARDDDDDAADDGAQPSADDALASADDALASADDALASADDDEARSVDA